MKITGFNPIIASSKAEEIVKVFEELGFEKRHSPVLTSATGTAAVTRMKHENGYHVDVLALDRDIPRDMTGIRINVDDFDEAYELFTSRGFAIAPGDSIVDLGFAKTVIMVAPSGFMISLMQHIKK